MGPSRPLPDRRRGVPERLLLPPGPREAALARRWAALPFETRRRLARASLGDPAAPRSDAGTARTGESGDAGRDGEPATAAPEEAELVTALARARVRTGWRLQVGALVWGWLVLMTLWGFGRSTFPDHEAAWLAGGLAAGGLVWVTAAVAAHRRVARARAVASSADPDG